MPAFTLPVPAATALPEVKAAAVDDKPKVKSWEMPMVRAKEPRDDYNYKREVLPGTIYRQSYNDKNQHLPRLITRQDYENLLFYSATKNDVETTRALLNAGTNINAVSMNGETPLMVAQRSGATSTAGLLMARGGR